MPRSPALAAFAAAAPFVTGQQAVAHAVAGACLFVNTDLIDDPGVDDAANLPLISEQSPDGKTWITDTNVEVDKTIPPHLGFGVGTDWNFIAHDMAHGGKTHAGFADIHVQLKYNWIILPRHEFMSAVQVSQALGRAGTIGMESGYDTTALSGFFGKGLGNIPWAPIRPFAVAGELDYSIPATGPMGRGRITTWSGGLTLQYSIPYLQSQVRNVGITDFPANLALLIELAWGSAAGASVIRPTNNPTTFLLGTGAVWTDGDEAVSAEILWPLNGTAGHDIGAIAQFHLYFDDPRPQTPGQPISEG